MGTPFESIYDQFSANLTDYKLAKLDIVTLEENLLFWLKEAIGFYPNPTKNLRNRNLKMKCFAEELNDTEIQALSKFMIMSYMNTHLMREEYLSHSLNSKDYLIYSPANQLKALRELKESIKQEANTLVSRNSYSVEALNKFIGKNKRK